MLPHASSPVTSLTPCRLLVQSSLPWIQRSWKSTREHQQREAPTLTCVWSTAPSLPGVGNLNSLSDIPCKYLYKANHSGPLGVWGKAVCPTASTQPMSFSLLSGPRGLCPQGASLLLKVLRHSPFHILGKVRIWKVNWVIFIYFLPGILKINLIKSYLTGV